MALLGPALHECAQTPMHRCPLGFASGNVSIEWSWASTAVALGGYSVLFYSPTRPWYLDAITSGLCLCLVMTHTGTCYMVTAQLVAQACLVAAQVTPPVCGPTLSACWVSSQTRPYPDNLFPNIFCTYMPHSTTHHNAHRPGSGPGPPSSVTLILYQTEPEAVERGP